MEIAGCGAVPVRLSLQEGVLHGNWQDGRQVNGFACWYCTRAGKERQYHPFAGGCFLGGRHVNLGSRSVSQRLNEPG